LKFKSDSIGGFLAAVFLTAGCASMPETKYYTLSVPSHLREKGTYGGTPDTPIFIDVLPVTVPARLARPQLIISTKGQDPQLVILEQARWSSHFNQELRDAFVGAISEKIGGINESHGSRKAGQPVYRIAVELSQFDATVGGRINARFDWTITHSTQARGAACYWALSQAAGSNIESLVKGIQNVVTTAAERISQNLIELNRSGTATCRP
jgi:uncharacterized lipoprotein YmbA